MRLRAWVFGGLLFGLSLAFSARAIVTTPGFEDPKPFATQGQFNDGNPLSAPLSGLGAVVPYGAFDSPTVGFAAWEKFVAGRFEALAAQYAGNSGALQATLAQATATIGVTSSGTSNSGQLTVGGVDYFGRLTCGLANSYDFAITATSAIALKSVTLAIKHSNFFEVEDPGDPATWTQIAPFTATLGGVPSAAAVWSEVNGNFSDAIALSTMARYYLYTWEVELAAGEAFIVDFASVPETLGFGFSVDTIALSVTSVPEPATVAVIGIGLAAMVWRIRRRGTMLAALLLLGGALPVGAETPAARSDFWLDLYRGEEVGDDALLDDLATAQVIYIGEIHTLARHHAVQAEVLAALAQRGVPLALGLEQIEARNQADVDRFNRGELDFDGLAAAIDWKKQWKNYEQYRGVCEVAQRHGIPLRGLNAPALTIRAVGRGGLAALDPKQRAQLPAEIVTDDPAYEKLMNLMLAVHASMDPAKLRPIFEAQVARDETMAANIVAALRDGKPSPRAVVVLCGSGHISFGLGTPDRVGRRAPEAVQRILLVTESGELVLGPKERAMSRPITITHGDLRSLGRPLADYLRVMPRAAAEKATSAQ